MSDRMKTSEALVKFLPSIYQADEHGVNVKKLLVALGISGDETDVSYQIYGNINDVQNNTGVALDATAAVHHVFRLLDEDDESLRARILLSKTNNSLDCSLPSIQKQVDNAFGRVTIVVENMEGQTPIGREAVIGHVPINKYEQISFDDLSLIMQILRERKAGGVKIRVIITDVLETWGDVYNVFPTWGDLTDYVW